MNWLIYISGWILGLWVTDKISYKSPLASEVMSNLIDTIVWTMAWVWICWRFIR